MARGAGCGKCTPPLTPFHAPLGLDSVPTVARVEVYQEGEDCCLSTDGLMEVLGAQDSAMQDISFQRKVDRLPFQIFPDPVDLAGGPAGTLSCLQHHEKERLPSIVVEPTDVSEVESGELRWPPEEADFEEDEDLFLEQCIPPANIADWGDDEEEETSVIINNQQNTSLIEFHSEVFTDATPTLTPESEPALN